MSSEVSHYVVTAHPPGGVLCVAKGNFLESSSNNQQICIAKSRRLELRTPSSSSSSDTPFPIILSVPINGRIVCMLPIPWRDNATGTTISLLFILTVNFQYAVLRLGNSATSGSTNNTASASSSSSTSSKNNNNPYPVQTLASGHIRPSLLGKPADGAPLVTLDPLNRCLALHLYDGFLTMIPIHANYILFDNNNRNSNIGKGSSVPASTHTNSTLLGEPYHIRIEELNVLDMVFLQSSTLSHQLAILQQDARGMQHVNVYMVDLRARQLFFQWKKQRLDGGSSTLIAVPATTTAAAAASTAAAAPPTTSSGGGVLVLGQRQITYICDARNTGTHVVPLPTALILSHCPLPPSPATGAPRYLLGDEFGNVHMLTIPTAGSSSSALELDTLGSTNVLSSAMVYMEPGWVFVGSQLGDSQLLQIHPDVCEETSSYLSVLDEFINLGPIVDLDITSSHNNNQQQSSAVVTASGSSTSGTLRLVRNGIGMKEFAAVELAGIQNMWAVRQHYGANDDHYLVQSYVGETRILGVSAAEEGATLEEVVLEGLDSTTSSLYVGNVQQGDLVLQITDSEIRLLDARNDASLVHTWTPDTGSDIAVAAANEAGQIVVALRGGHILYLQIVADSDIGPYVKVVGTTQLPSEVSCLNVNPFAAASAMETDTRADAELSAIVTVGLWDDFTVRVLTLDSTMTEVLQIHLSTEDDDDSDVRRNRNNMMARSLCLVTLDASTSKEGTGGVDMLFVGLGDGTLISFAVVQQHDTAAITVQSKKEVSLGTQRINLIPLQTELGGTCVLATGDRPTVIYLAGGGGSGSRNPKLCYSNVNLSADDDDDANMPESIAVNVAAPFFSPQLFDDSSLSRKHYSLCVSDDSILRLGVIDDIQKLHVTTCRLGMAPRRVVHCPEGRLFAVGCIESGIATSSSTTNSSTDEVSMGNCIRFLDETTFDDLERIDLEPHEMILSMVNVQLATSFGTTPKASGDSEASTNGPPTKPFLLIGTAYALPDEDEPGRGRILLLSCDDNEEGGTSRSIKHVTELQVRGGVYSICQFYNGLALVTVNSKTQVCQLTRDGGALKLSLLSIGHHGHILSLMVQSKAPTQMVMADTAMDDKSNAMEDTSAAPKKKPASKSEPKEQLAIVGDLMRSISLVQYYPEHKALEEVACDFNSNWTTAIEMLTDNLYLGAENWNNLYVLRRNAKATSEEVRCRLDTVGWFHLGELCNKFISGSLTMPQQSSSSNNNSSATAATRRKPPASPAKISATKEKTLRVRRPVVTIGSQTLYATVDGTLGSILGLDARTAAFFTTLERAMSKKISPVGNLGHAEFRTFDAERRIHPSQGFVDGDLVESFLDLDRGTMERVVDAMNRDGGWEIENHNKKKDDDAAATVEQHGSLVVEDVLAMVEEMSMFH